MLRLRTLLFIFLSAITVLSVPLLAQDKPYRNENCPLRSALKTCSHGCLWTKNSAR